MQVLSLFLQILISKRHNRPSHTMQICALLSAIYVCQVVFIGVSPSRAAEAPPECCAGLADRVAELEASAARKGNRRMSLQVSGLINHAVFNFDDGGERNTYQTSNLYTGPRIRFEGEAVINVDWRAGFKLYTNVFSATSFTVNQNDDNDQLVPGGIFPRRIIWYLDNKHVGRISVGRTAPGVDNLIYGTTSGLFAPSSSDILLGSSLAFRNSVTGELTGITPLSLTGFLFALRRNTVLYTSPVVNGLTFRAGYGEDDTWGLSATYAKPHGDFDIVARAGYLEDSDATNGSGSEPDFLEIKGVVSALHRPTGFFFDAVHVHRSFDAISGGPSPNDFDYTYGRLGWITKLNELGRTVFFGELARGEGGLEGIDSPGSTVNAGLGQTRDITKTTLNRWGFGVSQNIDAVSMELYAGYHNLAVDVETVAGPLPTDPLRIVYTGAAFYF